MTTYLRFPDESTAKQVLCKYLTETNDWITATHEYSLDPVGEIADLEGWHVNLEGDVPEEAQTYIVTPDNPVRVFAT